MQGLDGEEGASEYTRTNDLAKERGLRNDRADGILDGQPQTIAMFRFNVYPFRIYFDVEEEEDFADTDVGDLLPGM